MLVPFDNLSFYLSMLSIKYCIMVGSVMVNILSYRYRADKSTIFGMRGLSGLTINSGKFCFCCNITNLGTCTLSRFFVIHIREERIKVL